MVRRSAALPFLSILALLTASDAAFAQSGGGATACPPGRPLLSGPASVQSGQSYAVSWSNVLTGRPATTDFYWLERATDSGFTEAVDRIKTNRPTVVLPAAAAGVAVLYHRIVVNAGSCPTTGAAAVVSNTLAVGVRYDCAIPEPVGELQNTPRNPPALSTYVVSWNGGTSGAPGPGGGVEGLKYRVRRTTSLDSREWVTESATAAFTDLPGDYVYQVRAEAPCGSASVWSSPLKVTVGNAAPAALVLLSEPSPLVGVAPKSQLTTSLVVRNGGSKSLDVTARSTLDTFLVSPASFTLAPGATTSLAVTFTTLSPTPRPVHAELDLSAGGASLKVPLDASVGKEAADATVAWSDPDLDIDAVGSSVLRSIVNPGKNEAAFVSSVKPAWLSIESLDGNPWDAPLRGGEARVVKIKVDRAQRRATSGTEVGVIALVTAGHESAPESLVVVDDGPPLTLSPAIRATGAAEAKTRLLYAAMPNATDAKGEGRFTSDLWLTNMDAVSPLDVSLFFTPVGAGVSPNDARRADLTLAPGETRRYRNVVGSVGYEGACEVEVRAAAPTLSATALVNNKPLAVQSRSVALLAGDVTLASPAGQYGFEMRPTVPGEGVKATDTLYVVSGIAHDAKRRSNVLLTETSGASTTVQLDLFQSNGSPVTRAGRPVQTLVTVPALGTVQINDVDLFSGVDTIAPGAPYVLVSFQAGEVRDGGTVGSVVPFATVIDAGTEDASLRVGVSTSGLNPVPPRASLPTSSASASAAPSKAAPASASAAPMPEVGLPFGGGPAPLLFPTAHLRGAALGTGEKPFWRTRVMFTNVNESQQRAFRLSLVDQNGEVRQGAILALAAKTSLTFNDVIGDVFDGVTPEDALYGAVRIENVRNPDGSYQFTWSDVDVQTETYTLDPADSNRGQFSTGMEGASYLHGYTSFQSNLGTVQIDGAETSSRYRTNLILEEVGGSAVTVAVSAYLPGTFVPMATVTAVVPPFGYISKELFRGVLGLNLSELTDVRVVVRQIDGDGVFLAFASKINLATGDPANIFLRPATAGTGR